MANQDDIRLGMEFLGYLGKTARSMGYQGTGGGIDRATAGNRPTGARRGRRPGSTAAASSGGATTAAPPTATGGARRGRKPKNLATGTTGASSGD
jgi:hypothetical protein